MRLLYYTKRNGTILHIGKEFKSIDLSIIFEDLEESKLTNLFPNKIAYIPTMEDQNLMSIYNKSIIDIYNKQPIFKHEIDEQCEIIEEIAQYSKSFLLEDVDILYEDYLTNIKNIILMNDPNLSFKWLSLDEINFRQNNKEIRDNPILDVCENPYIHKDYDVRYQKLGNDLLNNGTYWAYVLGEWEDGKYYMYEGTHRLQAMKLMQSNGLWDDRKMLCLVINTKAVSPKKYVYPDRFLDINFPMIIPFYNRYPYGTKITDKKVKYDLYYKNIKILENDRIEVYPETYKDILYSYMKIPVFLKFPLFNLESKGNRIGAKSIINHENEWNEWIKNINN